MLLSDQTNGFLMKN